MDNEDLDRPVDIIKERSIIFDKKQCSVRIPQEMVNYLDITKGDKFKFLIKFPKDNSEDPTFEFEVIKNG